MSAAVSMAVMGASRWLDACVPFVLNNRTAAAELTARNRDNTTSRLPYFMLHLSGVNLLFGSLNRYWDIDSLGRRLHGRGKIPPPTNRYTRNVPSWMTPEKYFFGYSQIPCQGNPSHPNCPPLRSAWGGLWRPRLVAANTIERCGQI